MVSQGRQSRAAYVELDIEALGQMAMDKVSKKFEALDGAIKGPELAEKIQDLC